MLNSRQLQRPVHPEQSVLVRSYAVVHPPGLHLPERRWPWHVLAHAHAGVMSVHTERGTFVVPPHRAVWVPAGERHAVTMAGRVDVRTLYFASRFEALWERPRALQATPLVRELIKHVTEVGALHDHDPAQARLAEVVLDQLQLLEQVPLELRQPHDPRAARLAERLLAQPALDLDDALSSVGASRRTLERCFVAETGFTLGRWHKRARLLEALRRLAAEEPVTDVAIAIGYESASAFIAAFKRELGSSPGRYFRED